jgi:hypothetical protein
MFLKFDVLDLSYWSLEKSDTVHRIIRNINSSDESQNTLVPSVNLELGSKWRPLLCYLMAELVLYCSVININMNKYKYTFKGIYMNKYE